MSQTITGHFDGKVIVPDKPLKLPVGKLLRIQFDVVPPENGKQPAKRRKIKITGAGQFNSGLTDLATNKKYMEGFGKS